MNKKTTKSHGVTEGPCLCQIAGSTLTELMRRLGPPEAARQHFEAARLEVLQGLRAMLDARIEQRTKVKKKGEKITVE